MKRSLLIGLLFLLASNASLNAQTRVNNCGLGTMIEIKNGTAQPACSEDLEDSTVEFRARPFYMTYAIVVTDADLNLVAITRGRKIDFSQLPGGSYRVYGLFYQGQLLAEVGMNANTDELASICYGFTENFIEINASDPDAGLVTTLSGLSTAFVCANDPSVSQIVDFATTSNTTPYTYAITNQANVILAISETASFDFSSINESTSRVYGISYQGDLLIAPGDTLNESTELSSACFDLSDNFLSVQKANPDGGNLSFINDMTTAFACENGSNLFDLQNDGNGSTPYVYIITSRNDIIVDFTNMPVADFSDLVASKYRVYGAAYTGDLLLETGVDILSAEISTGCSDRSDNFLSITIPNLESDNFSLADGGMSATICRDGQSNTTLSFTESELGNQNKLYLITDTNNTIVDISISSSINFASYEEAELNVWCLAFTGSFLAMPGDIVDENTIFSSECYDLSDTPVNIQQVFIEAGDISLLEGGDNLVVCLERDLGNSYPMDLSTLVGPKQALIATDLSGNIQAIEEGDAFTITEGLPVSFMVYGVSYSGSLNELIGQELASAVLSDECYLVSSNSVFFNLQSVEGGTVQLDNGETEVSACVMDDIPDLVVFDGVNVGPTADYRFVLTNEEDIIILALTGNSLNFDITSMGVTRIYGASYTGNWVASAGQNIFEETLSDACFDISDNFIQVNQIQIEAGSISLEDGTSDIFICKDGLPDILNFQNSNTSSPNFAYFITDNQDRIVARAEGSSFNFDNIDLDTLKVWGVAYSGNLFEAQANEAAITDLSLADECFELSDNVITVIKTSSEAGIVSLRDESSAVNFCSQATNRFVNLSVTGASPGEYAYIITDQNNIIQSFSSLNSIDFNNFDLGTYLIYGLVYQGTISVPIGIDINTVEFGDDCFDLTEQFVMVSIDDLDAGSISLSNGETEYFICQRLDDVIFSLSEAMATGDNFVYLFIDENQTIIGTSTTNSNSLNDIGSDAFTIRGLSYSGELLVSIGDTFSPDLEFSSECYDLSDNEIPVAVEITDGGVLSFSEGGTTKEINCDTDGQIVTSTVANSTGESYVYLLTSADNQVIRGNATGEFDLSSLANGTYFIWGASYTGNLSISVGQNATRADISDACFDLTDAALTINKSIAQAGSISTIAGETTLAICANLTGSNLSFQLENSFGNAFAFIVTGTDNIIRQTSGFGTFELDFGEADSLLVYGLAYTGTLNASVGNSIMSDLSDACFELTASPVTVVRAEPEGGQLTLATGGFETSICPSDASGITFSPIGNSPEVPYYLLVTNEDNEFMRSFAGTDLDLSSFPTGVYHVWGVVAAGQINVREGEDVTSSPLATECFDLSDNFVSIKKLDAIGGQLSTIGGETTIFACPAQGNPKLVEFETVNTQGTGSIAYLLTDTNQIIQSILPAAMLDLDTLGLGQYQLWSLTFNGSLEASVGQDAKTANLASSCFSLSDNVVDIFIENPQGGMISANRSTNKVCISNTEINIALNVSGQSLQSAYTFLVTNDQDQFLFAVEDQFDFDFFAQGNLKVWGLAYTGQLAVQQFDVITDVALSDDCYALAENVLTVFKEDIDGGMVSTIQGETEAFACPSDGNPDLVQLSNNSSSTSANYAYIVTTVDNNIFTALPGNERDFDNIGAFRELRIWGVSYTGSLNTPVFQDLFSTNLSDGCFDISTNFVTIFREEPEVSTISTSKGAEDFTLCPGADPDILELSNSSTSLAGFAYILVNEAGIIDRIIHEDQINIRDIAIGNYTLYGISYTGNFIVQVGETFDPAANITDNCFELATNIINLRRGGEVDGSMLTTPSGESIFYTCPFDGLGDLIFVNEPEAIPGTDYRIIITGPDNRILFPDLEGGIIPFDGAAPGEYRIWGVSFTGEYRGQFDLDILTDPLSTDCYELSSNFITVISDNPDAGSISTTDGATDLNINQDLEVALTNNSTSAALYRYLITDTNNTIVEVLADDTLRSNELSDGAYLIYGLNHTGNFTGTIGEGIDTAILADNCFDLSDNSISLNINQGATARSQVEQIPSKIQTPNISVGVYPNPATNYLNIQVERKEIATPQALIQIIDLAGSIKYQVQMDTKQGLSSLEVPIVQLTKGVYLLRVIAGNEMTQQKFIKVE